MEKRPLSSIFLAGFISLIGLMFLFNGVVWYAVDKDLKKSTYRSFEARIADVEQAFNKSGILPNKNKNEFNVLLTEYKEFVQRYSLVYIEKFQFNSMLIGLLGIFSGVFYIMAAINILKMSKQAEIKLLVAIVSGAIFLSLLMLFAYKQFDIIFQATHNVTLLGSFIKEEMIVFRPSSARFFLMSMASVSIIFMILIFFIIPYLLLKTRPLQKILQ